jgi:hypothetical protein
MVNDDGTATNAATAKPGKAAQRPGDGGAVHGMTEARQGGGAVQPEQRWIGQRMGGARFASGRG